ncbi:MAG TPA: PilT/PilU family type 4a pilus ATPase [Patescibacteria group bacterium]|nr:PilT/PilU family type 4a pilus ATPase [Patescibacteria group bacterium]
MEINKIFKLAKDLNASDIHLSNNLPVYFRIDGKLKKIDKWGKLGEKKIISLIETIIKPEQKEKLFKQKFLELSHEIKAGIRFRIIIYFEKNHLSLSARLIPSVIPSMEEINMPQKAYELSNLKNGLILVTGPTGCGKSTTLASIIENINQKRPCHVVTLEDPIEFVFKPKKSLISQRELNRDMTSFKQGLKHVVRQDPDVILVSEMRDLETISLAITLAETGHLILGTLHTPSAAQSIDRIIDVFPQEKQTQIRFQLAMSLQAIISQHLLPRKNEKGRIAGREILINTPAISNLIRQNKTNQIRSIIQTGSRMGMRTLEQDLKRLYQDNKISKDIARSYSNYSEEIFK